MRRRSQAFGARGCIAAPCRRDSTNKTTRGTRTFPGREICQTIARARSATARDAPSAGRSAVAVELAFLGHALERLAGTLDAVLVIIAVGRQQLDDLVRSVG